MANDGQLENNDGRMNGKSEPVRRKVNDPASPYYLHSSDYPGMHISGITLRGESNFREWVTAMKNAFRAKQKIGFLDGTIKRPDSGDDDLEDWMIVNSMMVGWIMTAIDPALRTNVTYMDDAIDLWEDLKLRFDVGDAMKVHELKESIRACRQGGEPVTLYFGRLKQLWDEYVGYCFVPTCTCGGCKCDLEKKNSLNTLKMKRRTIFCWDLIAIPLARCVRIY
ncbi:unnamed protein product [Cuscuta epithymum]|uniref:Retrotransposon Copia-like N-terminal domain-containing protein n=1 Tax=Cuscuta epithymum TaxID=186058 RepID=A0AAV0DBM8_9ASTE|nr:unnamed protein product [Cuscuta epithymum]